MIRIPLFFMALLLLAQCGDALVYGDRSGFNLAVISDAPKGQPLVVNAGLRREIVAIIPGERTTTKEDSTSTQDKGSANGEAVSLFSSFKMTTDENQPGPFDNVISIGAGFATGAAAEKLMRTGSTQSGNAGQSEKQAQAVAKSATIVGEAANSAMKRNSAATAAGAID